MSCAVLQAGDIRTSLGSGLLQLGITPKSMLGLYSVNCKEWVLLDAAAHSYSMVSVPLYDTLGPDAVEFICNHAELAAVGCSAAVLPTLMSCLHKCPSVKLLVRVVLSFCIKRFCMPVDSRPKEGFPHGNTLQEHMHEASKFETSNARCKL